VEEVFLEPPFPTREEEEANGTWLMPRPSDGVIVRKEVEFHPVVPTPLKLDFVEVFPLTLRVILLVDVTVKVVVTPADVVMDASRPFVEDGTRLLSSGSDDRSEVAGVGFGFRAGMLEFGPCKRMESVGANVGDLTLLVEACSE